MAATSGVSAFDRPGRARARPARTSSQRTCSSVRCRGPRGDYARDAPRGRPGVGAWSRSRWPAAGGRGARAWPPAGGAAGPRPDGTGGAGAGERMSYRGRRPGPRGHPDLQRGRQPPPHRRPAAPRRCRRPTSWSPTTTARTAPARSPTAGRRRRATSTCCTGPASRAWARRTSPASAGPWPTGYDAVVEMDADGSHAPEELPRLLDALRDADVVHRLPLGARRQGAQLAAAPAAALPRRQPLHPAAAAAAGARTPPAATGPTGGRCWTRSTLDDGRLAGLLLPGRPGLAHLAGRLPGRRGADHVRRAGARRRAR